MPTESNMGAKKTPDNTQSPMYPRYEQTFPVLGAGEIGRMRRFGALRNFSDEFETLLTPPEGLRALIVAEADPDERIMRTLILRRVSFVQSGAGGRLTIRSSGPLRWVAVY